MPDFPFGVFEIKVFEVFQSLARKDYFANWKVGKLTLV